MTKSVKKVSAQFRKKYKIKSVTCSVLLSVLEEQGYTVIPFRASHNDADVAQVIDNLNLNELAATSSGFTYADDRLRLVFVKEELSDEEKRIVLAHEEGHIFNEHFNVCSVVGQGVLQEHEANEFAHYLLYPSRSEQSKQWMYRRRKAISVLAACLLVFALGISVFSLSIKADSYYGEYYVTENGGKYHRKECIYIKNKKNIHRLTKEEYESGEYEACKVCLPDE